MPDGATKRKHLEHFPPNPDGWANPHERLKKALADNEFILYRQSILRLSSKGPKRAHFEIFVRFMEEEQNLTPPGTFLPLLESCNLGPELDRYVVRSVIEWCRAQRADARPVIHINLCESTLDDAEFGSFVETTLRKAKLDGSCLCFEMPGVGKPRGAHMLDLAHRLTQAGCAISVGGFDEESIDFQPLADLNASYLKIGDRLTRCLAENPAVAAEVSTAARACQAFGVQTIVQFVETARTLDTVRKMNVHYAQGYGISKPQPLIN